MPLSGRLLVLSLLTPYALTTLVSSSSDSPELDARPLFNHLDRRNAIPAAGFNDPRDGGGGLLTVCPSIATLSSELPLIHSEDCSRYVSRGPW